MFSKAGRRDACARASLLAACAGVLLVAGCGPTAKPNLALSCQFQECTCKSTSWTLFRNPKAGKEVLWRQNGDAYCPEGYKLEPLEE